MKKVLIALASSLALIPLAQANDDGWRRDYTHSVDHKHHKQFGHKHFGHPFYHHYRPHHYGYRGFSPYRSYPYNYYYNPYGYYPYRYYYNPYSHYPYYGYRHYYYPWR